MIKLPTMIEAEKKKKVTKRQKTMRKTQRERTQQRV